jgi:hypothetical protein
MTEEWLDVVERKANAPGHKVYCRHCVYRHGDGGGQDFCFHPATCTWSNTPLRPVALYPLIKDKNANLDCPDYDDSVRASLWVLWHDNADSMCLWILAVLAVLAFWIFS